MNRILPLVLASLGLTLSACASQNLTQLQTSAPGNVRTLTSSTAPLFSAHFVKAYGETIAQNEPIARQDPTGPARTLLNIIANARQTLDGAFYDIDDPGVVEALIAAKTRGVRIRLVTENENLLEKNAMPSDTVPLPPRQAIVRLQQAGIPIVDDHRSALMHHKFLIADQQAVWMGSTNLTPTSLYQHNNNALVLRHPQVVANYQGEFERMFTQKIFGVAPRQIAFPVIQAGSTRIETFFSPRGGGTEAVVKLLSQAKKRISFMTFSFTDQGIAQMMIQKKAAGLRVEGVYDQCLAYGPYSTKRLLSENQIYTRHDGNEALLHHKVILVDDTVVTGSFNFSASADKSNNENMLIIHDPALAAVYYQEYERVMQAAKVNRPPKNKCPGEKPEPPVAQP